MKTLSLILVALLATGSVFARGNHSSHMSASGTGAKSSHTHVSGYTKQSGTHVMPHERSTPDRTRNNNWSTKGNTNPATGKPGTQRGDQ